MASQNLASPHQDLGSQTQTSGDPHPFLESIPYPDPFPFHLPGIYKQTTPRVGVQRISQRLGNLLVQL